jgi:glutamate-1-semialdehyde 2,1-aminomutase
MTRWSDARAHFERRYIERTPRSREHYERARTRMPGGVPGNAGYREPHPLYIAHAAGTSVRDVDGNEYLDMLMGGGPHILGHMPPAVLEAVTDQLAHGTSALAPSEHAYELASTIHRHMPHVESLRFTTSGSDAMHHVVRAARAATGRERVAKFEGNFHGGMDNQLVSGRAFGGDPGRPASLPDGAGIPRSVVAETLVLPYNDPEGSVRLIEEHAAELAAVVVEPIAGTWMGGVSAAASFLQTLRAVTAEHGILLVFDEVVTGFRVALGGAAELTGVTPDLTALAKIIGGGFPLGAFGGSRELMDRVLAPARTPEEAARKMFHSGTFQNNLISLRAGLALLGELEKPGVLDHVNALGDRLRAGVEALGERHGIDLVTSGHGSIVGIHFATEPVLSMRDVAGSDREGIATFCLGLLANGIFITTYHLALTNGAQTEADIDRVLEVAGAVFETMVGAEPGRRVRVGARGATSPSH